MINGWRGCVVVGAVNGLGFRVDTGSCCSGMWCGVCMVKHDCLISCEEV